MRQRLVVRQLLELQSRCGLRRIGVVLDQVAPPDLQRVHADLGCGEVDQPFGHCRRDRVTDRAVLAHHVLVGEHDARLGAIVRAGVGPAGEIDDLVGLDAAGARIDRVGADAGQVVDLERGDRAVFLDADLRFDAVIAGVNVGDEALDPVGDEFHRPLEQLRQRDCRHLVGIGVDLDAERAADVLGDDAHLLVLDVEVLGEQVLHHVRGLGGMIDGQALLALVPVGDQRARLVADAGVAAERGTWSRRRRPMRRMPHRPCRHRARARSRGCRPALCGSAVSSRRSRFPDRPAAAAARTAPRSARKRPRLRHASARPRRIPLRRPSRRGRAQSAAAARTSGP